MIEPLTDGEAAVIEASRRLARSLIRKLSSQGVQPADATIGLAYALHDAASELTGDHAGGLEWIRTAIDVMERQVMGGGYGKPTAH